jgi:succinate dehydrogenase flavin-adding protein (antitoxin of CptAB toxin-antitoxin module)
MLELDLVLGGFWSAQRATLRPDEKAAFERLLAMSDMEIADRLQGRTRADDPDLAALIQCLQQHRDSP